MAVLLEGDVLNAQLIQELRQQRSVHGGAIMQQQLPDQEMDEMLYS